MPCSDGYGPTDPEIIRRLNTATRVACELGKVVKNFYTRRTWNNLSEETKHWLLEHKKIDKQREKHEKNQEKLDNIKRTALSKLSIKEKKALGLKFDDFF